MAERVPAALQRAVAETCTPVRPLAAPAAARDSVGPLGVAARRRRAGSLGTSRRLQRGRCVASVGRLGGSDGPGDRDSLGGDRRVRARPATVGDGEPDPGWPRRCDGGRHDAVDARRKRNDRAPGIRGALFLDLPHPPAGARLAGLGGTRDDGCARADLQAIVAGALAGLGAGLVSDASWRLYCHVSDPGHVLVAHAGAIVALTAIGAAGGWKRRGIPRC